MDSADSPSPAPDVDTKTPHALHPHALHREVFYPRSQSSGVGVMLVASAAMFFAVASSAFILRVQMPTPEQQCPHRFGALGVADAVSIEAVEVELVEFDTIGVMAGEPTHGETAHCGGGSFVQDSDNGGPTSIVFRLCEAP